MRFDQVRKTLSIRIPIVERYTVHAHRYLGREGPGKGEEGL